MKSSSGAALRVVELGHLLKDLTLAVAMIIPYPEMPLLTSGELLLGPDGLMM